MNHNIHQQIQAEEHYPQDDLGQEDFMFYRLAELVDENALDASEAFECYNNWLYSRRVSMLEYPLEVPKAFYE